MRLRPDAAEKLEAVLTDHRRQIGDFLRSRRERLIPLDTGADTRRRRTPGLRREEVASLAGISAEWYVKLEQGRAVAPSTATTEALARALRLDEKEAAHLRELVRGRTAGSSPELVPEPLRRFVSSLPSPAYVTGIRMDMLAWNSAAEGLFPDLDRLPDHERNILLYTLTKSNGRRLFGDQWEAEARRMLALFRVAYDMNSGDPAFLDVVSQLRASFDEFDAWWSAHDVASPDSGTKVLHHPEHGAFCFDYTTLQANDDPRLKLVVYMPCKPAD